MRSTLVAFGVMALLGGPALAQAPQVDPAEVIRKFPDDPRGYILSANAAMRACDLPKVERDIRTAMTLAEKHPKFTGNAQLQAQMRHMLASSFAMGGQHAKALTEVAALLKDDPENADYLFMRAQAYAQLERLDDALTDTDTLISQDSGNFKAWQLRAFAQYRLKQFKAAAATFTIIKENTDDLPPVVLSMRGQALAAQGKYDDALSDYDDALKLAKEWREQLNTDDLIERDIRLKKENAEAARKKEDAAPNDAAKIRAALFEADQRSLLPTNSLRCQ